jgi:hypothetical protein
MSGPNYDRPISIYGTGSEDTVGASHSTWYVNLTPSSRAHRETTSTDKGQGKTSRGRTPAEPADSGDDAPTGPVSPEPDDG